MKWYEEDEQKCYYYVSIWAMTFRSIDDCKSVRHTPYPITNGMRYHLIDFDYFSGLFSKYFSLSCYAVKLFFFSNIANWRVYLKYFLIHLSRPLYDWSECVKTRARSILNVVRAHTHSLSIHCQSFDSYKVIFDLTETHHTFHSTGPFDGYPLMFVFNMTWQKVFCLFVGLCFWVILCSCHRSSLVLFCLFLSIAPDSIYCIDNIKKTIQMFLMHFAKETKSRKK